MEQERNGLRNFKRIVGSSLLVLGGGLGLAVDGIKALSAYEYNDFTPSGLWSELSETTTLVGNHLTRMTIETPPSPPWVAVQVLGIAVLVAGGLAAAYGIKETVGKVVSGVTNRNRRSTN